MKKNLIFVIAAVVLGLAGCIVVPARHRVVYVAPPVVIGAAAGVAVASTFVYDENIVYPEYETAYIWDPIIGVYFFAGRDGLRHNMPHRWNYRTHGAPYRRH